MSWPIYSERLLSTFAAAPGTYSVNVPAGHRAVLKMGSFACLDVSPCDVTVSVAGVPIYLGRFQAVYTALGWEGFAVAYGLETISVQTNYGRMYASISGFLFSDSSGRTGPLEDPSYERLEGGVTPLPALLA